MDAPDPRDPVTPPGRSPSPLPRHAPTTALDARAPVPDPRTPGDGPLLGGPPGHAAPRHAGPPSAPAARPAPDPAPPAPPHTAVGPTIPVARPGTVPPGPAQVPPRTPPLPWAAVGPIPGGTGFPPAPAGSPPPSPPGRRRLRAWWPRLRHALSRPTLERHVALGLAVTVVLVGSAVVVLALVTGPPDGDRTAQVQGAPVAGGSGAPGDLLDGAAVQDPAAFGTDVLTFRSPTGNIACRIAGDGTRCSVASRTWTPPSGTPPCPPDGAAVVLSGSGPATTACDAAPGGRDPVLGYDRALRRGDVTCVSRRDGVECRDAATGHGFAVARTRYRVY